MGVFPQGFSTRRAAPVALALSLLMLATPAVASELCELRTREARAALRLVESAAERGDVSAARRDFLRMRGRLRSALEVCPEAPEVHAGLARIEQGGVAAFERARSVSAEKRAMSALDPVTAVDAGREASRRLGLPEWTPAANQAP